MHDENETHERMILFTDMGRCRFQHESLCGTDMAAKAETNKSRRFVSLIDYVCINPLHDEDETHERMFLAWATSTRPRHATKEGALQCTVSLVDYVCSNPLHEESETHERMFLRTDMGMSASIHCMIITNGCGLGIISAVICVAQ